jgi:hypothetical protein
VTGAAGLEPVLAIYSSTNFGKHSHFSELERTVPGFLKKFSRHYVTSSGKQQQQI